MDLYKEKMSKKLLIIGILSLLLVISGCERVGNYAPNSPAYSKPAQPPQGYVDGGCSVQSPSENEEGEFEIVYIPLRLAL